MTKQELEKENVALRKALKALAKKAMRAWEMAASDGRNPVGGIQPEYANAMRLVRGSDE